LINPGLLNTEENMFTDNQDSICFEVGGVTLEPKKEDSVVEYGKVTSNMQEKVNMNIIGKVAVAMEE